MWRPPIAAIADALPRAFGLRLDQAQLRVVAAAEQDHALAAGGAERGKFAARRHVGVEDRRAALRQQLGEEAALGREIGRHVGVIIEMVACQIGERRRRQGEPVEAELVEPVARRLDRDVLDALLLQGVELAMEQHRVGRGEAAGLLEIGADDADRAEARRAPAVPCPDLPREGGDRGLAVGAGDGGDRAGLGRMKPGREQREAAARRRIDDDGDAERGSRRAVGCQHRRGAVLHRIGDEAGAVGARSGQRREEVTGFRRARVRREPRDFRIALRRCQN